MTEKKPCYLAGLILSAMLLSPHLLAAQCTIDSKSMDRGEKKAFIICGKDIPRNYTLKGLSEAGIIVEYEQRLEMCGIGIDTPGIYLILKTKDDARTAPVSILDSDTGKPVCEDLMVAVPDRIHTGEASLEHIADQTSPLKILTIKTSRSQDLSRACVGGLSFPEGKWPSLSLLSKGDYEEIPADMRSSFSVDRPIICTESSIKALVKVYGQQRYPAKVIISKVKGEGGEEKEGVAYVMLPPPAWASAMKDEDAKYIDVNGIRTRYFDEGEGEALLLVHGGQAGATGTAQGWEQNFDYLSKYFHVYAVDRLGMGYTDNPLTDEDYEQYYTRVVEHVYGFIRAVGIKKVHLVGHSQGGWPVTRIALDHPEMVKSLVNVDGNPAPRDPLGRATPFFMYLLFFLHPPEGPNMESLRRGSELGSYSMNNITDERLKRALRISNLPKIVEAAKQMQKHSMNPNHQSYQVVQKKALEEIRDGKLRVPTLAIWGYHDPIMPYEVGMELFKLITNAKVPGSRLVVFDKCSHSPHAEYPELFNRTIKSFCGAYSSRPID